VLVDGNFAGLAHQQRVAIGGRRHHRLRPDRAGRAGAVLDHHVLAERHAERLCDQAGDDVTGSAGRIGDDDMDVLAGEGLRRRRENGRQRDGGSKGKT
jgi:hypothetical protein